MKAARKVGVTKFKMPISAALERAFERTRTLRLVRKSKMFELHAEETDAGDFRVFLREGAAGTAGKVKKKLRCRAYDLRDYAVRQAMQRMASGWSVEGVKIDPKIIERWLAEVKRIGKSPANDWLVESERALG